MSWLGRVWSGRVWVRVQPSEVVEQSLPGHWVVYRNHERENAIRFARKNPGATVVLLGVMPGYQRGRAS